MPDSTQMTDEQLHSLEVGNVVMGCFSLLGSIFIISCYFRFRELRSFAFRLVFTVSCCDFFYSLGNMLGDAGGNDTYLGASPGLCMLQSLLLSHFGLASMLWSVSIAFTLHMAFLKNKPGWGTNEVSQNFRKIALVCFGFPFIMTILPLFTSSYGNTGGWCWIKIWNDGMTGQDGWATFWRFVQFYIPLWCSISYNIFVYYNVHKRIKSLQAQGQNMGGNTMLSRMKLYPLVLIICFFPGTINILYELTGNESFALNLLNVLFAAGQGLANALVYGFTPAVRDRVSRSRGCSQICKPFANQTSDREVVLNDDRDDYADGNDAPPSPQHDHEGATEVAV